MFTTFDGPSGEACVARREQSNTPLQALTLLNDTVFLEAAQSLGSQAAALPEESDDARAAWLFARCLSRPPTPTELGLVSRFYATQAGRFAAGELNPALLSGPETATPSAANFTVRRAAWTATARAILNLDEMITKE
jgi:hypothetical protein